MIDLEARRLSGAELGNGQVGQGPAGVKSTISGRLSAGRDNPEMLQVFDADPSLIMGRDDDGPTQCCSMNNPFVMKQAERSQIPSSSPKARPRLPAYRPLRFSRRRP